MNELEISPDQGVGLTSLKQVESLFAMYAVIATGGKQVRVAEGQQVHVELLGLEHGASVDFTPVLVVDGDTVLATPTQLAGSKVSGRIVGSASGPKINGFTYKRRTNQRRRYKHSRIVPKPEHSARQPRAIESIQQQSDARDSVHARLTATEESAEK